MTFHLYNLWKEEKERDGLMKREYIRILVIIVINIILAGIFFAVLDSLELREELYANPTLAVIIGGGFSLFLIVIAFVMYKFLDRKPIHTFGFSFNKVDALFALIISIGLLVSYWLFIKGVENAGYLKINETANYFSSGQYLLILPFFFAWVLGALQEEIINRAYFYANLRHLNVIKMLIVSSLIFAFMHVFKGLNLIYFISLFINGFLFMYIYIKSGNIWVGTIIHAMMNFCNGYFFNEDPNTRLSLYVLKDIQEAKALPLLLGFQVGLVVLLFVLTRITYNQKEKFESNLKNQKTFKL